MSKKYYSIQNKADKTADIMIYGVIGDSWFEESITARQFVADLKALEKDNTRINVRINSPGGSVFDGLPIFNALKNSTSDIHTYNDGLAASMAALVLLSGKTVHGADNSLTMFHSPMTYCGGNASDIQQVLDMLAKVQDSLIVCITSKTGEKPEDVQAKYFDYKDHWLNAEEAKNDGLIDMIEKGENKISNKVTSMSLQEVMDKFNSLVKGKTIFDKLISNVNNIFSPTDFTDMDIKLLRNACGLAEDASEQQVLDFIEQMKLKATATDQEPVVTPEDPEPEPESVEPDSDVTEKDKEIANLKQQISNLKKAPGAPDKKVSKQTDADKSASEGFDTYQTARETFNAVTSMMK